MINRIKYKLWRYLWRFSSDYFEDITETERKIILNMILNIINTSRKIKSKPEEIIERIEYFCEHYKG